MPKLSKTRSPIVVYGAGGFGREVAQLLRDLHLMGKSTWEVQGFVDDAQDLEEKEGALPVLGGRDWLMSQSPRPAVAIGVGAPAVKQRIARFLIAERFECPPLVHPRALVGERVTIGAGTIICANSILSCDIEVGPFVTMNLACTIGHDVRIGDYATLAPGVHISGSVRVGEGSDIGTGASTVQGLEIGDWTVVGAGAVVSKPLAPNLVAVGVPARPIKSRDPGWQNV